MICDWHHAITLHLAESALFWQAWSASFASCWLGFHISKLETIHSPAIVLTFTVWLAYQLSWISTLPLISTFKIHSIDLISLSSHHSSKSPWSNPSVKPFCCCWLRQTRYRGSIHHCVIYPRPERVWAANLSERGEWWYVSEVESQLWAALHTNKFLTYCLVLHLIRISPFNPLFPRPSALNRL